MKCPSEDLEYMSQRLCGEIRTGDVTFVMIVGELVFNEQDRVSHCRRASREQEMRRAGNRAPELSGHMKEGNPRGSGASGKRCGLGVDVGEIVLIVFRNSFLMGAKTEKINKFQDWNNNRGNNSNNILGAGTQRSNLVQGWAKVGVQENDIRSFRFSPVCFNHVKRR